MAEKPNTDGAPAPTPEQEVRRLYEEAESRVAKAAERVVARDSFGELLAMVTENAVAVTRKNIQVQCGENGIANAVLLYQKARVASG